MSTINKIGTDPKDNILTKQSSKLWIQKKGGSLPIYR